MPVVANVDAEPKRTAADAIDALIRQVSSPVRWEDVVTRLVAEAATRIHRARSGHRARRPDRKIDRRVPVVSIGEAAGLDEALADARRNGLTASTMIDLRVEWRSSPARRAASAGRSRRSWRRRARRGRGGARRQRGAVAEAITAAGGKAEAIALDVADRATIERAVAGVIERTAGSTSW